MHEAHVKMVEAKELVLECSVREGSGGKSGFNVTGIDSGAAMSGIAQKIELDDFDPVLASTPQNSSSTAKKDVDVACSMFDDAFKDELSISLTEVQSSGSLLLPDIALLSDDKLTTKITSLPLKTPRPKRYCTELTTSYAEDDLAR